MDTAATIEKYIVEEILMQSKTLDHDASLIEGGVLDSLSLLRLIGFVEQQFEVHIADTEVVPENFESIRIIADLVAGKKSSQ